MKSLRKTKGIIVILLMFMMMFGSTLTAYAASDTISADSSEYLTEHGPGGSNDWPSSVSGYFQPAGNATSNGEYNYITLGGAMYAYKKADAPTIDARISAVTTSSTATSRVTDVTDGLGISADTGTATVLLSGFTPLISTFLGIMVVAITLFMTVFTAFDVAYIAFPVLRGKMEASRDSGGAMAKTNNDGSVSLRFVTDEAQYAVKQATVENGKNALAIYFGKRCISYIALAIVLFILLTGNISLITNLALKVVDGVLRLIQGIA